MDTDESTGEVQGLEVPVPQSLSEGRVLWHAFRFHWERGPVGLSMPALRVRCVQGDFLNYLHCFLFLFLNYIHCFPCILLIYLIFFRVYIRDSPWQTSGTVGRRLCTTTRGLLLSSTQWRNSEYKGSSFQLSKVLRRPMSGPVMKIRPRNM